MPLKSQALCWGNMQKPALSLASPDAPTVNIHHTLPVSHGILCWPHSNTCHNLHGCQIGNKPPALTGQVWFTLFSQYHTVAVLHCQVQLKDPTFLYWPTPVFVNSMPSVSGWIGHAPAHLHSGLAREAFEDSQPNLIIFPFEWGRT